ncbi:oligosaccharide flippase family protein [Emcibacteraceae bacterium]|nr:oligosaccharide flippase family protein [Emcibacteraceae bacterium]
MKKKFKYDFANFMPLKFLNKYRKKALFKDIKLVFMGNFLSAVLGFMSISVVALILNIEEFGLFIIFITIAEMISFLTEAGLNKTFVSLYSRRTDQNQRNLMKRIIIIKIIVSFFVLIIGFTILTLLSYYLKLPSSNNDLYLISICSGILISFNSSLITVFQAIRKFRLYVALNLSVNLLRLIFLAICIFIKIDDITSLLIVYMSPLLFTALVSSLLTHVSLKSPVTLTSLSDFTYREIISFSAPLAGVGVVTVLLQRTDLFLLSYFCGMAEVALFGLATQVARIVPLISTALTTALLPHVSAISSNDKLLLYRKKIIYLLPLILLGAVLAIILMPYFLDFVFLDKYAAAERTMQILILGFSINLIFNPLSIILYNLNKTILVTVIHIFQLPLLILFDWLLIPRFGSVGAAVGSGSIRIIGVVILIYLTARLLSKNKILIN